MRKLRIAAMVLVMAGIAAATPASAQTSQASHVLPTATRQFIAGGFGQAAAQAPAQNQFITRLVGVWSCEYVFDWGTAFPATWAFKHAVGGFAVEHLYFQYQKDLVPPFRELNRDFHIQAFMLFDPATGRYHFLDASNVAGTSIGPATSATIGAVENDRLIFSGGQQTRAVFGPITQRTFQWSKESSPDGGTTWVTEVTIACTRRI